MKLNSVNQALLLKLDPERGAGALLAAWQRRPWRAEPLHDLARHYRLQEQDPLALVLAERAVTIPSPVQDSLFVHREVYAWGCLLEVSIAGARSARPGWGSAGQRSTGGP